MYYIEAKHIQRWIGDGSAVPVPVDVSKTLGEYLEELPWSQSGTGLDWEVLVGRRLDLSRLNSQRQLLRSTFFEADPFVIFWYGCHEPGIACRAASAIDRIDEAFWGAPGKRYLFGGEVRGASITPVLAHFAEYDGASVIIAVEGTSEVSR